MTRLPTGGRPPDGRSADQNAQQFAQPRLPTLPPRAVPVLPGPPQPAETLLGRGIRRAYDGCRIMFYMVMPLALLAAIAAGVLYVRLRHGPIAFDFVVAPIERGINAELTSASIKIDGAELRLGDTGEFEFRLRDVSVLESGGDVVLSSPLAAVNISTAALLRGRVVPSRIELIDPIIALAYSEETGFVFERAVPRPVPVHPDSNADAAAPTTLAETTTTVPRSVEPGHKVNLAKMLSESSRRARKRLDATSYLTEFGISNATLIVDYEGQRSSWRIDDASVDFNHAKRRSVISGRATVASQRGPWAFSFLTDERETTDKLEVKATVRDLVPSTLASAAPPLALLGMFEFPVAGDATIELSRSGDVESSEVALEVGQGRMTLPYLTQPTDMTAGLFKLTFDGKARRWDLQPSPVKWTNGAILFKGEMTDVSQGGDPPQWQFALDGKNGIFEAPEFNVPPLNIDECSAHGTIVPRRGFVDLAEFKIAGGGGTTTIKASTQAGPKGQNSSAEVTLSPMPINTLKVLWPRSLAEGARDWVGKNVSALNFKGGTLRFTKGVVSVDEGSASIPLPQHYSADFEADNAVFQPFAGMQTIEAEHALVHAEDNALEVTVPNAAVVLSDDRRLPLQNGRFYEADITVPRPLGEITVSTTGELGPFLEAVQALPVRAVRDASPLPKAGEGKVDAQLAIKMPIVPGVTGDDIAITGKARITDGRFGKVAGRFDVQGFTLDMNLTETSLDAKGDLLVNGVPAKIVGQRILGADADQQPPLKIVAKLDESDRTQLGLDVNNIVHGIVPVEVSLQRGDRPEPAIKLHADLSNAEIVLDQLQWRKPAGRQATVDAEIVGGQNRDTELQNFKIASDDISAQGTIRVGPDNKVKKFEFPGMMLNVISRLDVEGTRADDDTWTIAINGSNFDGRSWFRSLFNIGDGPDRKSKSSSASKGAHVTVNIANVIGGSDVSLRKLKMTADTRGGNLVSLDASGTLDGGAPLVAKIDQSTGVRRLRVDSPDAGQVLKLVGFYPNMQGGRLRLEVDLDGAGPAEKTGTLWVDNFRVLGDQIVSEVVSGADQGRPAIAGSHVTREVFDFDSLRAPFSVGYGQFVLEETYVNGPVQGANLRGKVDLRAKTVNIGGTYIPLQGLNGAIGDVPLLGKILGGVRGDGVIGMTFVVQGPTSNPEVIVNPLSIVAPGIFRDIFQMTADNPKVQVRGDAPAAQMPVEDRVRASSMSPDGQDDAPKPKSKSKSKKAAKTQADAVDGWSSTTTGQ